jgi:hypothetical protein
MKRAIILSLSFLLILTSGISCKRSIYKVNVSGINVNVRIKRLEQDLFGISPGHLSDSLGYLKQKHDGFLKYFGYVINIGEIGDSSWNEGLMNFCTDKVNNDIYTSTEAVFHSMGVIETGMTNAFRHYRYYFPSKKIPGVYTCITGFNNSIITGDSVLGIGLDRYLGPGNKFYKQLQIYKYQLARMKPENILSDCMYGWASSEWDYKAIGYLQNNVLADIIHEGKLLFFAKCMLPETPDELIFGFSPAQMNFCKKNEGLMWQYLVEHNLLFSSDMLTRKKLTGEAPFTSFFSSESPGRASAWTGFRIVESYMSRNREVTLEKLMTAEDIQEILEKAGYRPSAGRQR